jgi:uncharacterized protein
MKIIKRDLENQLLEASKERSIVAVLGPRQSGKTTLVRHVFPNHTYVDLDDLENRAFAQEDPKEFLKSLPSDSGIILDEIQNVPDLFSYIKVYADELKKDGYFILTGSQNFALAERITQSLAGRVAELTLMPLSINELDQAELLPSTIEEYAFKGSYPELYKKDLSIPRFYGDYIDTYIKKDVRQLLNIKDQVIFKKFIKTCAARTGQLLNLSSIAEDLGVAPNTVKEWLSVLVATYVVFLLEPYNKKIPKRLIKSPKLFFHDTGLVCSLLGIRTPQEVSEIYLRGNLIETCIMSDLFKQYCNLDIDPDGLYFFRTQGGEEIDAILNKTPHPKAIEIKAGKTISPEYFRGLKNWQEIAKTPSSSNYVIYGGDNVQQWPDAKVIGWKFSGTIVKDALFG